MSSEPTKEDEAAKDTDSNFKAAGRRFSVNGEEEEEEERSWPHAATGKWARRDASKAERTLAGRRREAEDRDGSKCKGQDAEGEGGGEKYPGEKKNKTVKNSKADDKKTQIHFYVLFACKYPVVAVSFSEEKVTFLHLSVISRSERREREGKKHTC